jgi:sugar phosphate isomerase/epimerase
VISLKNRFPFRLGTTSYILPADVLTNARYLARLVDDIQLVLFESPDVSNLPDADTIARLADVAEEQGVTYTVHFPLDVRLGAASEAVRRRAVAHCRRIVELTAPLDPFGYAVHFDGSENGEQATDARGWRDALERSARDLAALGVAPEKLGVETLAYPFEQVADIAERHGFSVCLDIGHVQVAGRDLGEYLDRYLRRARVLHVHGVREGQDHESLREQPRAVLADLMARLAAPAAPPRVVTVEVFDPPKLEASLAVLEGYAA